MQVDCEENNEFLKEFEEKRDCLLSETCECVQISEIYTRHSISEEIRNRLLDWMAEVIFKCESTLYTFFLSVNYLDRYFQHSEVILSSQNLHISGIIAMSLACKYEEANCISLSLLQTKVAHNKFSISQLLKMEIKMLKVLKFDLKVLLPADVLRYFLWALKVPEKIEMVSQIIMVLNRFEFQVQLGMVEEAASCLFVACKTEGNLELAEKVLGVVRSLNEDIEYAVIWIQNRMCEYKIKKPAFRRLFVHLGFEFESLDKTELFKFV